MNGSFTQGWIAATLIVVLSGSLGAKAQTGKSQQESKRPVYEDIEKEKHDQRQSGGRTIKPTLRGIRGS